MPPISSNQSKMSVGNKKNNSIAKDEETGISHDCTMYRSQNNSSLWTQDRCLFALQIISAIFVCACVMFLIGSSLFQTKVNQTFTSMSSQRHVWKVPLSSERYLDEANDRKLDVRASSNETLSNENEYLKLFFFIVRQ